MQTKGSLLGKFVLLWVVILMIDVVVDGCNVFRMRPLISSWSSVVQGPDHVEVVAAKVAPTVAAPCGD